MDGVLAAVFALLVIIVIADAMRVWRNALLGRTSPTTETPYVASALPAPSELAGLGSR
ncbi:hypothetical protein C8D87_101781 [Lentzea atacamensis]|uniref:Uncharacterized protein n=1 Tax=Lentzea atacamensis TaxID=531938 RepID=A0ABX9EKJ2_9PSEU|nr:hypothetical protein [Lentzea atacamensis]RAS70481.1 hypothetical protein C8D87_101781 [Lentzea atacamensis]